MRFLLILLLALSWGPLAIGPLVAGVAPGAVPQVALQQPTPEPEGEATRPRVSLAVFLALVCICNLSTVALAGSYALKRRFDSINPDK